MSRNKNIILVVVVVIIIVAAGVYLTQKPALAPSPETQEEAPATENATSTKTWYACDDRTKINVEYNVDSSQAKLGFHDELLTLNREQVDYGIRYVEPSSKLEFSEADGKVTIKSPTLPKEITCNIASKQ
jgi:hypothetical protein